MEIKLTRKSTILTARLPFLLAAAVICLAGTAARGETLSGDALIDALRDGGFVIVMRHASSPREVPAEGQAAPGNRQGERQLDEWGRATATAMGYAFREFRIPVGTLFSSAAFRALETAKYFGFGDLQSAPELGGAGSDAGWLRAKVAEQPAEGENTVIITHARNLMEAFADEAADMQDGEALIFRPDGEGANAVARMPIEEWAVLAVN